jgi:hypothetical protein
LHGVLFPCRLAPSTDASSKVLLPIVPFLAYEGEIALGSGAKLREIWRGLGEWIKNR